MARVRIAALALAAATSACGDGSSETKPPTPGPDLARTAEVSARPLTAKDVEDFLVLEPLTLAARNGSVDLLPHLAKRGVDPRDWPILRVRIGAAYRAVHQGSTAFSEGDVKVVRPFEARIEEALRRK